MNAEEKTKLNEAVKGFGIEDVDAARKAAARVIEDTANQGARARLAVEAILKSAGAAEGMAAILTSLLLPAIGIGGLVWVLHLPSGTAVGGALVAMAGTVSGLTVWARGALAGVKTQLDTLDRLRKALADKVEIAAFDERAAMDEADKAAGLAAKALAAAELQARAAADKVAAIELEQTALTGSGRLNRFIREKATNGDYAKHLGIIASVHKDFAQLSVLLRDQNTPAGAIPDPAKAAYDAAVKALIAEAGAEDLAFQPDDLKQLQEANVASPTAQKIGRIVLYIDDLDRCPPEKVVEVLQAIHMFLYFPLFVVFVAVDARWLKRSLQVRYGQLIANGASASADPAADAQDYLEKIFQIPFWVNPMSEPQGEQFVDGLTLDLLQRSGSGVGQAQTAPGPDATSTTTDSAAPTEPRNPNASGVWLGPAPIEQVELSLSQEERRALKTFGALLGGSPRRTKRFVNTYLLIRMGLTGADDTQPDQIVWPIVAMTAVVVGARTAAGSVLELVIAQDCPSEFEAFKAELARQAISKPEIVVEDRLRLERVFSVIAAHPAAFDVLQMRRFAPDVGRFSF